ncbi:MAG: biopolymer transporter ExbD [Chthoniobacteraceae bacterium]
MRRFENNWGDGNLGFQIAPMIDVVFVIMLFFMVMAGSVRVERELNSQLPGNAETSNSTEFVDEQIINIAENGEVMLNDEPFDAPGVRELPDLTATLMRLKTASDQAKAQCLVTVISEAEAKYSRTIDVLNALAVAGVTNVTFTVSEED